MWDKPNVLKTIHFQFFLQYEIIFCIQEVDDPAHEVVRRLMNKHPNIEASVVTGNLLCMDVCTFFLHNLSKSLQFLCFILFK